jgi:hypothetical protein
MIKKHPRYFLSCKECLLFFSLRRSLKPTSVIKTIQVVARQRRTHKYLSPSSSGRLNLNKLVRIIDNSSRVTVVILLVRAATMFQWLYDSGVAKGLFNLVPWRFIIYRHFIPEWLIHGRRKKKAPAVVVSNNTRRRSVLLLK